VQNVSTCANPFSSRAREERRPDPPIGKGIA
jgi:hypothetical protein